MLESCLLSYGLAANPITHLKTSLQFFSSIKLGTLGKDILYPSMFSKMSATSIPITHQRRSEIPTTTTSTSFLPNTLTTPPPNHHPKPWDDTRGVLATVGIGISIAITLWLTYLGFKAGVRIRLGRREDRYRGER